MTTVITKKRKLTGGLYDVFIRVKKIRISKLLLKAFDQLSVYKIMFSVLFTLNLIFIGKCPCEIYNLLFFFLNNT